MRKTLMLLLGAAAFFLMNCTIIDQNLQARKNLANCKYELDRIELKKIDFDNVIVPKSVWFDIFLRIENTASSDVALDRIEAEIFLDQKKFTTLEHKNFVRIKPKNSISEPFFTEIPFVELASAIGKRPVNVTIKGKVYVNIFIGSYSLKTPLAVAIEKTFPIPYDKIEAYIKKKQEELKKGLPVDVKKVNQKLKKIF